MRDTHAGAGGGAHGGEFGCECESPHAELEDEEAVENEQQDGPGPLVSATRPLKGVQRLRKRHSNFSIGSSFSLAESSSPSLSSLCSRALAHGSRSAASRGLANGKHMAVLQVSNDAGPDVHISYPNENPLPPLPSFYLPDKIPDVFLIVNTIDRARTTDDWIDLKRAEQQNSELEAAAAREAARERRPRATRQHTCLASGDDRPPVVVLRARPVRRRAQSFDSLLKHLSLWSRAATVDSEAMATAMRPESAHAMSGRALLSPQQQQRLSGAPAAVNGKQIASASTNGDASEPEPEHSTQVTVTISLPHSNRKKTLQVRIPRRLPRRATQESLSDPPLEATASCFMSSSVTASACRRESATSSQLTAQCGGAGASGGTSLTSLLATPIRSWVWSSAMKRHLHSLGILSSEEKRADPIASEAAPLLLRAHNSSLQSQERSPTHPAGAATSFPVSASPARAQAQENSATSTTACAQAHTTGSKKRVATTACCRVS